jgi:ubiquinone/menaquinone biosynthesis C-methylase UbiE
MRIYRRFLHATPWYLAKYYWWAYLFRPTVWFFDHQWIINAILFGQYKKLMRKTLALLKDEDLSLPLQLTSVYGCLSPTLAERAAPNSLHLTDVATVQLEHTLRKIPADKRLYCTRMNAEHLGYADACFSCVIVFFLLHELPVDARERVLREAIRVLKPGGKLLVTEYGSTPNKHLLYRFGFTRWVLGKVEPFLPGFWQEDLNKSLQDYASDQGHTLLVEHEEDVFNGFYRVVSYRLSE